MRLIAVPALVLSFRERFLKHGWFTGSRLKKTHDLIQLSFGHRSENQPPSLFTPRCRGAFFQAEAVA